MSTHAFYTEAQTCLAALDPQWAAHIEAIGPCLHQPKPTRDPYQALVRAIAYQQLHAKAGDAILARFLALYPGSAFPSPEQVLATTPEQLRACGFSASKLATIQGIARARLDGLVPDYQQALMLEDEALIERLVSLRGVGRWDRRDVADLHPGAHGHPAGRRLRRARGLPPLAGPARATDTPADDRPGQALEPLPDRGRLVPVASAGHSSLNARPGVFRSAKAVA